MERKEVKSGKVTILAIPRKDGKNSIPDQDLIELAEMMVGKPFKREIKGPVIGIVTRAWVTPDGVKAELKQPEAIGA